MRKWLVRGSVFSSFLLLAGALMIALAVWRMYSMPDVVQYMVPAPPLAAPSGGVGNGEAPPPHRNVALQGLLDSFHYSTGDLNLIVSNADLSGAASGVMLTSDTLYQKEGALHAVGAGYFNLYYHSLAQGRYFYQDELRYGGRVIILNEEMAFALFRSDSALDHTVTMDGVEYRVVGVVRAPMAVGKREDHAFFVPIAQIAREEFALSALTLSGKPIPGMGASTAFPDIAKSWQQNGDVHILRKEAMYGTLLARALAFFLGMGVVLHLIRRLAAGVKGIITDYVRRLQLEYAKEMIWLLLLKLFGALLSFLALIGAGYLLISFAIEPVFVFTEWVPSVLVDPREIIQKFWAVQIGAAKTVELRSPEILRVRFFGSVSNVGVVVMLLGFLARAYGKRREEGQ